MPSQLLRSLIRCGPHPTDRNWLDQCASWRHRQQEQHAAIITAPSSSPFRSPRYVTVSSDFIFVTDTRAHSVFTFRMDGSFVRAFGSEGSADGQFNNPQGITYFDGSLYVADYDNKRLCVFGPDGSFIRKWVLPFKPHGLTCGGVRFFITDTTSHRIHAYRSDGTLERSFGSKAEAEGKLDNPYAVCYSADYLFVTNWGNHSVSVFRSDGRFVRRWGVEGSDPGQLDGPTSLVVHDNKVLVTDSHNPRISVFSTEGAFIRSEGSLGSGPDQFNIPMGIALTDRVAIIVDFLNKRLRSSPLDSLRHEFI